MHWPWDRCELWVGYLSENGDIKKRVCVAGGDPSIVESPSEPKWSPEEELFFVTDRKSGFWNIYRWVESTNEVFLFYSLNSEFTQPFLEFWLEFDFLQSPTQKNLIACNYRMNGKSHLGILEAVESKISLLYIPFTDLYNIKSGPNSLYVQGASAICPLSLAKKMLARKLTFDIVLGKSLLVTGEESINPKDLLDAQLETILGNVKLLYLLEREGGWDSFKNWEDILSLGEQQILGMARLFFHKPHFGILHESTNATSVDVEEHLYKIASDLGITVITSS